MRRCAQSIAVALILSAASAAGASAAVLKHIGDFEQPIHITSDPADPDRLLVVEREGRVILAEPSGRSVLADLSSLVLCCSSEQGLLSIAPAPDFGETERFYAAYSGTEAAGGAAGDLHVDAFRPVEGGGEPLREEIIAIAHPDDNHFGGQLQFGPDGNLFISTGDSGGAGDPGGAGQSLETLLGKILRIDPLPEEETYAIPPDNPFATEPGEDEIWSYGLRNPWRFSFDALTGDMVIGDVGQDVREEVDFAPNEESMVGGAGANYGWNCREGLIAYPGAPEGCPVGPFTDPVFEYPHTDPGDGSAHGCSVTGGFVVRDTDLGDLYGRYVYSDFCTGKIRSLSLPALPGEAAAGDRSEGLEVDNPVSFGEDSARRVYVVARGGGIFRLAASPGSDAAPDSQPSPPPASGPIRPTRLLVRLARDGRLVVRVKPCRGNRGRRVQLNRGGRRLVVKRVNRRCVARFRLRPAGRSTFRVVLMPSGRGGPPIRSRPVVFNGRD
jgi:hypothetical protein